MISSTAKYALRAVVYLANRPEEFVGRTEISEATTVPHEYLLKVLRQLNIAELVESRRGPGGGYRLTRSPTKLTALDVILSVDAIPRITECPLGIPGHEELCPLHRLLDQAGETIEHVFRATTIADLMPRKRPQACDFPNNI